MRVTFAGVGEAFDDRLANTSLLVESAGTSLLIDCGFSAATELWAVSENPLELDGLYITHFHADHYFGIPALLVRFVQEGRTKPLVIMGQAGVEAQIHRLMDMAYPNSLSKAQFDLLFVECASGGDAVLGDMRLGFAMSDHPMTCLSVRVESGGKALFYSSDGRPTEATRTLAAGCDLVVHESYTLEPDTPGHGTVDSSIEFGQQAGAAVVALVHISREVRRDQLAEILDRCAKACGIRAVLPEPGDSLNL